MSEHSAIQWTDATWNPVTGCSKVSQGCKHCYAERDWARLSAPRPVPNAYTGRAFTNVVEHMDRLEQPLRWRRPRRIFVNSMSDLFHDAVSNAFIADIFAVMATAHWHSFQVLTKRPQRMLDILNDHIFFEAVNESTRLYGGPLAELPWPLPTVWLGVSVEDQATADERIPLLLETPAAVRWISAEPLLDSIDLTNVEHPNFSIRADVLGGVDSRGIGWGDDIQPGPCLDWVVVGSESGPQARPMHLDWARSLRDQCAAAGVPIFVKQLPGERARPVKDMALFPEDLRIQEYPWP